MRWNALELQSLISCIGIFWAVVYLVHHFYSRGQSQSSVLPLTFSSRRSVRSNVLRSPSTQITLHKLSLRIHTTALNSQHDALTASLSKPAHSRTRAGLMHFYNLGSLLGFVGMLGSLVLLIWTAVQLSPVMIESIIGSSTDAGAAAHVMHKRGAAYAEPSAESSTSRGSVPLHMIIPGVTVPAAHLPILVLALIISQIIHEAGHAVTAAIEGVRLLSLGMGLTVVVPSAFVALPSADVHALQPSARLRIVSAGAFHNLLFWLLLQGISRSDLGSLVWSIGYRDVQAFGRVVASIDTNSPLLGHIPLGSVVTKVDDQSLSIADKSIDIWSSYLSEGANLSSQADLGWCVEHAWYAEQPKSCCTSRTTEESQLSCFVPLNSLESEACVDPLPFLTSASVHDGHRRCEAPVDCGGSYVCIGPRPDQHLLGLTLHIPSWMDADKHGSEKVVVWNGPREEVLEAVEVSRWLPRNSYLPIFLPLLCEIFVSYLTMITLALHFLNLLPLPFLDGAQFLDATLDLLVSRRHYASVVGRDLELNDLEEGGQSSTHDTTRTTFPRTSTWKGPINRTLTTSIWALIAFCALGGIVQGLDN